MRSILCQKNQKTLNLPILLLAENQKLQQGVFPDKLRFCVSLVLSGFERFFLHSIPRFFLVHYRRLSPASLLLISSSQLHSPVSDHEPQQHKSDEAEDYDGEYNAHRSPSQTVAKFIGNGQAPVKRGSEV